MNTHYKMYGSFSVKGNIKYIYKENSVSKSDLNIFIKRFNIISFLTI